MGKTKIVILDEKQRAELEKGWRESDNHTFRQRCQLILLKSEGRISTDIAGILGCCEMVVNNWVKRFEAEGIKGLKTRPGRGGKAILRVEIDLEQVRAAVQKHRQRLAVAKAELEEQLGKQFSEKTLSRFIKKTLVATNELGDWENASRSRKFIS